MCKVMVKVEKKVFDFYRRIVFGSNYKRDDINKDNIFNLCFNNAWNDMARTIDPVTFSMLDGSDEKTKKLRKNAIQNLKLAIKDYFKIVYENDEIYNIIENCFKKNDRKISNLEFYYGQAQKVVNMFFKYLYTFKKELGLEDNFFTKCHCPIDNITLKRIKDNLKINDIIEKKVNDECQYIYKGESWSKLSEDNYNKIQEMVDEIIKSSDGKYKNRLDYEFDWE
ncbi:MAG: hypothetical protein IKB06_03020 [Clostridia bacterium]|nr:hypothetical protein [Clostridia bacterium]